MGKTIVISGIVIAISGMIFHLQGKSIVGPQSSFMYSNPDWVDYGLILIIVGIAIVGLGMVIYKKLRQSHAK